MSGLALHAKVLMHRASPNFFIVGAPKAGTAALYMYLREHPEVFLPEWVKEPHFFTPELHHPTFVQERDAYVSLFAGAASRPRVGEASVFYLSSREAAARIRAFCPAARLIIMLRNPVEMIYALHNQHYIGGIEKYKRFEDALAAEPRRRSGTEAVARGVSPELLLYREIGTYCPQLKRCLACFPREQIHFIFFEDFVNDTATEYRKTLEFLGVESSFHPEFRVINQSRRIRSPLLQRILLARPPLLQTAARALTPTKLRHGILNLAFRFNAPFAKRPALDVRVRDELRDFFQADVQELSQLTQRDLTPWLQSVGRLTLPANTTAR